MDFTWIQPNIEVWYSLLSECEKLDNSSIAFRKGKVISLNSASKTIDLKLPLENDPNSFETKSAVPYSLVFQVNTSSAQGFNDMVDMENLNEAELLYNIQKRYENDLIYTYVGPTLLVLNPYQKIPKFLSDDCFSFYQKQVYEANFTLKSVDPHVYATSALCVKRLCESKKCQAIVISGESGAGKTENAKMAMKFITSIGKAAMSNYQMEPNRPLFNQRRSRVCIMKDDVPDLSLISLDSSNDLNQSKHNKSTYSSSSPSQKLINLKSLPNNSSTEYLAKKRNSSLKTTKNVIEIITVVYEGIEDKILSCNPILEGFGNAKTVRNDNSSRFGKLVILIMERETKKIKGAMMTNYLLEKSRVVRPNVGERNYHIFYHLIKGADEELRKELELKEPKNFQYLKASDCYEVATINDKELFQEINAAFKVMKFHVNEIKGIWNLVAAILHLGNLKFGEDTLDTQKNTPCSLIGEDSLKIVSKLLFIDQEKLKMALLHKTRKIGPTVYKTCMSKVDCETLKDSFSKSLYERLFIFLVQRLNYAISSPEYRNTRIEMLLQDKSRLTIDLLDIFGFEVFKKNSFEQFCINFANEKLQQLYISYVFKAEIEQFINEGLKDHLNELKFKDNQGLIDLFESSPLGLFNLLDESSSVASTDEALLNNFIKHHKTNEHLKIPKGSKENFSIIHTAKDVEYCISSFRMKNKDELSNELEEIMAASSFKTISYIFQGISNFDHVEEVDSSEEEEELKRDSPSMSSSSSKDNKFLGAKFRKQMKDLMAELNSCEVHFIRCIKPNEEKQKRLFVPFLALNQIRYLGVLESIKIRKDSYPIRRPYSVFFEKYLELDEKLAKLSFLQYMDQKADFQDLSKK